MTTTEPTSNHVDPDHDEWCGHDELDTNCPQCRLEHELDELDADPMEMGQGRVAPILLTLLVAGMALFVALYAPVTPIRLAAAAVVAFAGFLCWRACRETEL